MTVPSRAAGAQAMSTDPIGTINVLFCCDAGYYQHLAVAAGSLLSSNPDHQFDIHLIGMGERPPEFGKLLASLEPYRNFALRYHAIDLARLAHFFTSGHVNLCTYLRVFCAEVLPADMDKVLYLDADLVVTGDLAELWRTDVQGYAVAAVPEPWCQASRAGLGIAPDALYVNAGVLLINLRHWREHRVAERLVACIEEKGVALRFWDQDALNLVLSGSILPLGLRWNYFAFLGRRFWSRHWVELERARRSAGRPAIIHYTSRDKPWLFGSVIPLRHLYYRHLRRTAWRDYRSFNGDWRLVPGFLAKYALYILGINPQTAWDRIAGLKRRSSL